MKDKIWITWEDHRRSRELAKAFGADYICLTHPGQRLVRYTILTFKTIFTLLKRKPEIVFCQNPSIILNSLLCFIKPFFKYKVISDRHSNFKFSTAGSKELKWRVFHWLSNYTIRSSEITIVTNDYLRDYVIRNGGQGFVLPDKLPTFDSFTEVALKGKKNLVFITTFSPDEPITEVIEAMRSMDKDTHLYITGNYKKYQKAEQMLSTLPSNVTLTGFLSESEYLNLISSADILIVITTEEYTLTCGAYEAVSIGKPMIVGNTSTIRSYFSGGAVYSTYSPSALKESMEIALRENMSLKLQIADLKIRLESDWEEKFEKLISTI